MKLNIEDIKNKVEPIAKKYSLNAVYIFGSYARGDASDNSDIDILIDREGSTLKGMLDMGNLYNDLCESLKKDIDLITIQTLKQKTLKTVSLILLKILNLKGFKYMDKSDYQYL